MTTSNSILDGLNPAQREAAEAIEGPLLIVAGPGSGKTRVITHRIAHLVLTCGISPYRILAVTFTNKAAREMKERLQRLVGPRADQLTVGTFHAFCAGLVRREGKHIGIDPGFTIYDDDDQTRLLKQAMEQAEIDPKRYPPRAIRGIISRAKCLLIDAREFSDHHEGFFEDQAAKVYERYEELLGRNNAVDFDDLLMKAVQLLRNNPEVLGKYQRRFLHVHIDEFQDTNVAQYSLAKLLAGGYKNICVVGDADQSIYSWRHADIRNILSFQKDYPDARTVALEENYRSTGHILEAAKMVISANQMRLPKDLWTSKEKGAPVVVHETYDEEEEAQYTINEVGRLGKVDGFKPGDCAVMYRVNAQSRAMEEACLRYGMRYKIIGGVRFYQRKEVKDVIAYLRLLNNPRDDVSLARVINIPLRGIGQRSVEDLSRWATSRGVSMYAALESLTQEPQGQESDQGVSLRDHLASRAASQMTAFATLVQGLTEESHRLNVVDLIDAVLEQTGYRRYLFDREDVPEERWENIMELRNTAQEFRVMEPPEGLGDLLERLALVADVDSYEEGADSLTLITLHQAKGLEFPVVFMIGMEEGLLPHSRSMDSPEQLEEERRLCYVGMTRSQERLYLLRAFRRGFVGGSSPSGPSRFLQEIPASLRASAVIETPKRRLPRGLWESSISQPQENVPVLPQLSSGDKVNHPVFGEGMIVSCTPSGIDVEVTVAFTGGSGVKRLLQSFAHLVKVE